MCWLINSCHFTALPGQYILVLHSASVLWVRVSANWFQVELTLYHLVKCSIYRSHQQRVGTTYLPTGCFQLFWDRVHFWRPNTYVGTHLVDVKNYSKMCVVHFILCILFIGIRSKLKKTFLRRVKNIFNNFIQ